MMIDCPFSKNENGELEVLYLQRLSKLAFLFEYRHPRAESKPSIHLGYETGRLLNTFM